MDSIVVFMSELRNDYSSNKRTSPSLSESLSVVSKAELKAYVLEHRDDIEAVLLLFGRRNPPDSEATWYGPMFTKEGVPIEENIRIAEEALDQRIERAKNKKKDSE